MDRIRVEQINCPPRRLFGFGFGAFVALVNCRRFSVDSFSSFTPFSLAEIKKSEKNLVNFIKRFEFDPSV
jgi:hypothetical protein